MKNKHLAEIGGYIGMIFLQGVSLPVLWNVLFAGASISIPLYYIGATAFGLLLYLIRSIAQKDLLYTISNSIGLAGQGALITVIFTQ